jgi:hypothetical protein
MAVLQRMGGARAILATGTSGDAMGPASSQLDSVHLAIVTTLAQTDGLECFLSSFAAVVGQIGVDGMSVELRISITTRVVCVGSDDPVSCSSIFIIGWTEGPLTVARSIACRVAYRKILPVGRLWLGANCAGDSDRQATTFHAWFPPCPSLQTQPRRSR